jgi:hypothetical protein
MCMVLLYMNNDKIGNVRACQKCTEVHFYFMYMRIVLKFVDS